MTRLETRRLILREWGEKDADDIIEGLNDLNVSKWLARVPFPYTNEDAEKFIDFCQGEKDSYRFAIELKESGKVIGGLSLEKINYHDGTAGGGIWLNAKYHGKGYGAEAFAKRNEFAFRVLNLRRLENGFFEGNASSQKMQEKLGYAVEGKRRKGYLCKADGKYKDEIITALLKEEWETLFGGK